MSCYDNLISRTSQLITDISEKVVSGVKSGVITSYVWMSRLLLKLVDSAQQVIEQHKGAVAERDAEKSREIERWICHLSSKLHGDGETTKQRINRSMENISAFELEVRLNEEMETFYLEERLGLTPLMPPELVGLEQELADVEICNLSPAELEAVKDKLSLAMRLRTEARQNADSLVNAVSGTETNELTAEEITEVLRDIVKRLSEFERMHTCEHNLFGEDAERIMDRETVLRKEELNSITTVEKGKVKI